MTKRQPSWMEAKPGVAQPPDPVAPAIASAPAPAPRPRRKVDPLLAEVDQMEPLVNSSYRLTEAQVEYLRRTATALRKKRGRGRVDASEVLRAILDRWMAGEEDAD